MLVVPYSLAFTAHGLGVFAASSILRGQTVYRAHPRFALHVPVAAFDSLPPEVRAKNLSYTYRGRGHHRREGWVYFDADDSRFMNHSATPTLVPMQDGETWLAARDIAVGEELTCDYRAFAEPDDPLLAFLAPGDREACPIAPAGVA